ncbi:MAG TPA: PilZ domain-containing protein [Chthonomonadaceae bacterium]|nr:PilZ domain-containing protein [Chthonomonadaceae bacterium]
MLLLASCLPITLEVLSAGEEVLAGMAATLRHLDGEWALIALAPESPASCLHWGARVRFWIGEGPLGLEAVGAVTGHSASSAEALCPATEAPEDAGGIWVRLFACHLRSQRRLTPRRRAHIPVFFRLADSRNGGAEATETVPDVSEATQTPITETPGPEAVATEGKWLKAVCVDVSRSGMRLRTDRLSTPPERLLLRFTLPMRGDGRAQPGRSLSVQGRVLRCAPAPRRPESVEIAVKFEHLSVEEGLTLSAFLEG